MFSHCEKIKSIDLSSFNTSKVEIMHDLFAYCYSLVSVNVSSFDTSKVTNMQGLFYGCISLKYIDLSNFDTSSLKNLNFAFEYCKSLIYLNLRNFKIIDTNDISKIDTFIQISSNVKYCIEDSLTKNLLIEDQNSNCSDICFQENIKISNEDNICIESCDENQFEYNKICYADCPNNTFRLFKNKYICLNQVPENYYLDENDNLYKECFNLCKKCNKPGNETYNNCDECMDGYIFINEYSINQQNCFIKCEFYYYFNENNECSWTIYDICPTDYNKIINQKNKCIDDCKNDDIFKYEYKNTCLIECPENTKIYEEEKLCLD